MPWNCFNCFRNQVEDVHVLDYQHSMLFNVPVEVFSYERTLEELFLDENLIRDLPRPLFHCHGLKILSLRDNAVQALPPAVASLINLQQLDLSRNALSAIPDNIKCCKQLHCVDVSINPLEKLPEGFTQLINLEELYLNDTYLDFLPANFGRLTKLKILELRENNLSTLPKSIARLSKLERLDIGQNDFSDLPDAIGSLTNLTELWVDFNRIKSISHLIGNLKKLVHFDASDNNISWISSSIEKCDRLVDLTLTSNELQEIPSSVGNLTELITLKLDDNELRAIPSSIGNISRLQEFILSQNNLESLPSTIGLLRQLRDLNIDDNVLEDLPPEIGSCSSLTLLSVRNNKLQEVPAELGHLQRIKVINLSDNLLRNLPVSILKLTDLNALWLSNNQSTPLPILLKEFDRNTGQTVCVNFMLPQTPQDNVVNGQYTEPDEPPTRPRPHIRFAIEAVDEEPYNLLRAPTPYPKELRAMAKHARAIHQGPKRAYKEFTEDAPLLGKMRSPWPNDVQIKEAKVKKPETFSLSEQSKPSLFPALSVSESIQETSLHPAENRPVIREAKYVRQRTSATQHNGNKLCDESLQQSHVSMPLCTNKENVRSSIASSLEHALQPPPYHIAAAYSKQARWFGPFNPEMKVEYWSDNPCYDSVSINQPESNKSSDKHSATSVSSGKNDSPVYSALENRESVSLWSSQLNGTDSCEDDVAREETQHYHEDHISIVFEEESHCVENASVGTCVEPIVRVKNKIGISSHSEASDVNNKSKHLDSELRSPQIASKLFVDNLQDFQPEASVTLPEKDSEVVENSVITFHNTSNEQSQNIADNVQINCRMPSQDGVTCSDIGHKEINVAVPCVEDTFSSVVESHTDCDITRPSYLVSTFPESGTGNDSSYLSFSESQSSRHFIDPPQIKSVIANNVTSPLLIEKSHELPSLLLIHGNNFCQSNYYMYDNGQFLEPKASMTMEGFGDERGRQVPCTCSVLSHEALTQSGSMLETSHSVNPSTLRSFEQSYQQDYAPALTAFTPVLKSTKDSASSITCKKNSKLWRFGLHRNPTVLPIVIHKTDDLGVGVNGNTDMSLLPENQRGIFVASIDPSGPASGVLLPGDKLLEVDGYDFSKLSCDEAVRILQQTENIVHMMISRQQ